MEKNIIVFGAPGVDRRAFFNLLKCSYSDADTPNHVFDYKVHQATSHKYRLNIYDTAALNHKDDNPTTDFDTSNDVSSFVSTPNDATSLSDTIGDHAPSGDLESYGDMASRTHVGSRSLMIPDPKIALTNLYELVSALSNTRVHLLVYIAPCESTTPRKLFANNYTLFRDIFCNGQVPIILVTTDTPSSVTNQTFKARIHLGVESDSNVLFADLCNYALKKPKPDRKFDHLDWFLETSMRSWNLLEGAAQWEFSDCSEALVATLRDTAKLSKDVVKTKCDDVKEHIKKYYFRNVIFFGEAGVGKTSIISMLEPKLTKDQKAPVASSNFDGGTSKHEAYSVDINPLHFRVHDTIGLREAKMSHEEAKANLRELLLNVEGGVSLLVYVTGKRIRSEMPDDFKYFYNVVCQQNVPIVIVKTCLENQDPMDSGWKADEAALKKQGMFFDGKAYITTEKSHPEKYKQSKEEVKNLLFQTSLSKPWKLEQATWFDIAATNLWNTFAEVFHWERKVTQPELRDSIMTAAGKDRMTAGKDANTLTKIRRGKLLQLWQQIL